MTEATVRTKTTLHCALELSKSSWLLAIQFPDRPQPSLYRIKGGDAAGLMSQLLIARDRCAKAQLGPMGAVQQEWSAVCLVAGDCVARTGPPMEEDRL
jgi:hypothetical protein